MTRSFDYVIVGGGTAGCLLANRLSEDPRVRVALIEAGGPDRNPWIRVPAGYLRLIGSPSTDWCHRTSPQAGLGGRILPCPRGRTLGGSSAINAMIYMRGHRANYDAWVGAGATGWGWDEVVPLFQRHEDHHIDAPLHGRGGPLRVEAQRVSWPILDAALRGLTELGVPPTEDFNTGDNTGAGYFCVMQRRGRRVSAAHAFLHPVRRRHNLAVITGSQATAVMLDGRRAIGVRVHRAGKDETWLAGAEVILAAGSIGTPHLLNLSGIGDPDRLSAAGLAPMHALAGVGRNLIDHLQIRTVFRIEGAETLNTLSRSHLGRLRIALDYALRRRGPLTMAPSQAGAFLHSDAAGARAPDMHINLQPLSLDHFGAPLHDFPAITVSISNVQPESRGHVSARGPDWRTPPDISPAYLTALNDRARALWSVSFARRLMQTEAMRRYAPREHLPGLVSDGDALLDHVARHAAPLFHPCGTARMGQDDYAVVNPALQVRGLSGLRVADASVIPLPLSGGLAAPVMMIAERAAELVLSARKAGARMRDLRVLQGRIAQSDQRHEKGATL